MKTHEDNYKAIGANIKKARESSGMSQMDLAKEIGYETATAISLIEAGARKVSINDLLKVSELFQRDIKFFLGTEEEAPNVSFALRADKSLSKPEQDQIMNFIDFVKKGKDGRAK